MREASLVKLHSNHEPVDQARWDKAKERVAGVQALLAPTVD